MGLRLVAHYFERNEAFIALGALEASGLVAFLENHAQISVTPFEEIARGGYRLMVLEQELESAIAVLDEARRRRSFEGERLSQRTYLALSLLLLFSMGIFMPFRTSRWHEVAIDPGGRL
jgi:hypothetical protein